jgi:sodium transport system permease protein
MTRTITIFRKELMDTFRDKRTIMMMVIVPIIVVPLLIGLVAKVGKVMSEKAEAEVSKVAIVGREYAPNLYEAFAADSLVKVRNDVAAGDLEGLIREDSLDGAVVIPPEFERRISQDRQATVQIYFRSSNQLNATERRMRDLIEAYDKDIVGGRIRRLNLDENLFDAIAITATDVSSLQEKLGKTVGGFLPYMFVLLCFTGALYPGIDLGAGEKERGTLETILSSPASRLEIVLGKFSVIALVGLFSALASMIGLYLGLRTVGEIPQEVLDVAWSILSVKVVATIASLLIPLTIFFASVILAGSIYSKSFKEAQSTLTPFSFLLIVPVLIGLMPGVELSVPTALVPVLNVSLATKEVIAGTVNPLHLGLVYASLLVLAAVSITFCVTWFNREQVLFRT